MKRFINIPQKHFLQIWESPMTGGTICAEKRTSVKHIKVRAIASQWQIMWVRVEKISKNKMNELIHFYWHQSQLSKFNCSVSVCCEAHAKNNLVVLTSTDFQVLWKPNRLFRKKTWYKYGIIQGASMIQAEQPTNKADFKICRLNIWNRKWNWQYASHLSIFISTFSWSSEIIFCRSPFEKKHSKRHILQ